MPGFYRGPVKTDRAPTQHGFEFASVSASPVVAGIDATSGIGAGGTSTPYSAAGINSDIADLQPSSTFIDAASQKFVGNGSALTKVTARLASFAAAGGTVTCAIYAADVGGLPTGAALATSPDSYSDIALGSSFADRDFTFSGFTPANGTAYCFVVFYDDGGSGGDVSLDGTGSSGDGGIHDLSSNTWSENANIAGSVTCGGSGVVVATADANDNASGFGETGAVGTVTVTTTSPDASVNASGVSATSALGTVTVTANANRNATGVSASSALGTETVNANANESASGVSAASALGSVATHGDANDSASGIAAASALGNESTTADANANTTGVAATSALGDETVVAESPNATITATGVSASTALGDESVAADANADETGVAATSALGDESTTAAANTTVTGVQATSALGDESVTATDGGGGVSVTVFATGVSASSSLGHVSALISLKPRRLVRFQPMRDRQVDVAGLEAKSDLGRVGIVAQHLFVATPRTTNVFASAQSSKSAVGDVRISISGSVLAAGSDAIASVAQVKILGHTMATPEGEEIACEIGHASISAGVAVQVRGAPAYGYTMIPSVKAIKNPTDEELMVMFAAAMRSKKNPRSNRRL